MASPTTKEGAYWGYLINPDKTAKPLLEQLCLGIAKIIGTLEPGPDTELTPSRMAAFYRSLGCDYDRLFLHTSNSGLSHIYQILACFHSLQPTGNAREAPCIPSLQPMGYVRWQTIELLLDPVSNVPFMQEAVKRYDVPRPDGGIFPKTIPREAFPNKPDVAMVEWHRLAVMNVEQDSYIRRLKNSPYPSPRDPPIRGGDSYFSPVNNLPEIRRPSRGPRLSPHDGESGRMADARRRSSVPDIPTSFLPTGDGSRRQSERRQFSPPNSDSRQKPYPSPHRSSNASSQRKPSEAGSSKHRMSNSNRTSNSSQSHRPYIGPQPESVANNPSHNPQFGRPGHHSKPGHHPHHHHPPPPHPRSPSTIDESSSGSEASSEDSQSGHVRMSRRNRDGRPNSSLFPPVYNYYQRRHSHDASYLAGNTKPPLPPRPKAHSNTMRRPPVSTTTAPSNQNTGPKVEPQWPRPNVQFRNVFDPRGEDVTYSAPETPAAPDSIFSNGNSPYRPSDPLNSRDLVRISTEGDLSRENSGSSTDRDRTSQQSVDSPFRINHVSGVRGRVYPTPEPRPSFSATSRISPPQQVGMVGAGPSRNSVWG